MSDSESYKDQIEDKTKLKNLAEDEINELIVNHEQHWLGVTTVKFWQEVAQRNVKETTNCSSVAEIFARYKIVPKFKSLDSLFTETMINVPSKSSVTLFLESLLATIQSVNRESVDQDPDDQEQDIEDKIIRKKREVIEIELSKINKEAKRYLFPRDAIGKVQDLFMALQDSNRARWSERTYDNILYSAIFQCYFKDDFSSLGDQKINEYLPSRVANEVKSDLLLLSGDSPFLICEYGEEEHASNHKDLVKLLETMQRALTKRSERYINSTNYIYGVLCGGAKLALFYMEHDALAGNFPCYFLAANENELQTTTLHVENIATLLAMNIILLVGGTVQMLGDLRRGPEKQSRTTTPSKIDDSKVLSVHQTIKKTKAKRDKSDSSSSNTAVRRLEDELNRSESSKSESALIAGVAKMQISDKKSSKSTSSKKSSASSRKDESYQKSSKSSSKKSTTSSKNDKSSKSSTSNTEGCTRSTSTSERKDDPSDDSTGEKTQQQLGNPARTTAATANNNNNTGNNNDAKEKTEGSNVKEKRRAILAEFTRVGKYFNSKYTIVQKITQAVHIVLHKNCYYVAKFLFTDAPCSGEEKILSQLSDQFLKPLDAFFVTEGLRCLIFRYEESRPWSTQFEFRTTAYQVLCAIAELHEKNIMHGDIKFSNVIRAYKKTYLIDFDISLQDPETYTTTYHGTFGYRAPESVKNGTLSLKNDVYSYGIYLYELAHNKKMYKILGVTEDDEEEEVVARLHEAIKRMPKEFHENPKLINLINRCVTEDPDLRPTAKELIMDPFFDRIRKNHESKEENIVEPVRPHVKLSQPRSTVKNKTSNSPLRDITNTHK